METKLPDITNPLASPWKDAPTQAEQKQISIMLWLSLGGDLADSPNHSKGWGRESKRYQRN